jgi:hypothetical protein
MVHVIEPGAVVDALGGNGVTTSDELLEKCVALLTARLDAGERGVLTFDAQPRMSHHEDEEPRLPLR